MKQTPLEKDLLRFMCVLVQQQGGRVVIKDDELIKALEEKPLLERYYDPFERGWVWQTLERDRFED